MEKVTGSNDTVQLSRQLNACCGWSPYPKIDTFSADLPFTSVETSMAKNKQSIDIYKPEKIFFFANISGYLYP